MAQQERTEKATGRRRKRARDEGRFAYSQELTSALTLIACTVAVFHSLDSPAGFRAFFAGLLQEAATADISLLMRRSGMYFLTAAAPFFIAAVAAALAGNLLQGLPVFAADGATFKWDRL